MFTFKKNNKQTNKPVNRFFLQDDASAGIWSLQTSIEIKLPKSIERALAMKNYLPAGGLCFSNSLYNKINYCLFTRTI